MMKLTCKSWYLTDILSSILFLFLEWGIGCPENNLLQKNSHINFSPSYIISQYQKKLLYQFSENIFIFGIIFIKMKNVNLVMLKLLIQSINGFNSRWFCWNLFKTAIKIKIVNFSWQIYGEKKIIVSQTKNAFLQVSW